MGMRQLDHVVLLGCTQLAQLPCAVPEHDTPHLVQCPSPAEPCPDPASSGPWHSRAVTLLKLNFGSNVWIALSVSLEVILNFAD